MDFKFLIYLTAITLCSITSCDQKKAQNTMPEQAECNTHVMVKDYSGVDGCGLLLVTSEGEKLLPASLPKMDFELANNQALKIGFTEMKDAVSICMMESRTIIVNCVEFVAMTGGVKPAKQQCEKVNEPFESSWMPAIVKKYKPVQIDRYEYLGSRFAYYIDAGVKKMLYDCGGTLICEVEGKALNECTSKVKALKGRTTIWQIGAKD